MIMINTLSSLIYDLKQESLHALLHQKLNHSLEKDIQNYFFFYLQEKKEEEKNLSLSSFLTESSFRNLWQQENESAVQFAHFYAEELSLYFLNHAILILHCCQKNKIPFSLYHLNNLVSFYPQYLYPLTTPVTTHLDFLCLKSNVWSWFKPSHELLVKTIQALTPSQPLLLLENLNKISYDFWQKEFPHILFTEKESIFFSLTHLLKHLLPENIWSSGQKGLISGLSMPLLFKYFQTQNTKLFLGQITLGMPLILHHLSQEFANLHKSLQRDPVSVQDPEIDFILLACEQQDTNLTLLEKKITTHGALLQDEGILCILSSLNILTHPKQSILQKLNNDFTLLTVLTQKDLHIADLNPELPHFIYIFKKTPTPTQYSFFSCQITGTFARPDDYTKSINSLIFFKEKKGSFPTLFYEEIENLDRHSNGSIEGYFEYVHEGRIIKPAHLRPSFVTHPQFIKKLIEKCLPLEDLFLLQEHFSATNSSWNLSLYVTLNPIKLSTTKCENPFKTFYLTPRFLNISSAVIEEFFDSTVGQEICRMSLQNNTGNHLKQCLAKILVPTFLRNEQSITKEFEHNLAFFRLALNDLECLTTQEIHHNFNEAYKILFMLAKEFPWSVIDALHTFKKNIDILSQNEIPAFLVQKMLPMEKIGLPEHPHLKITGNILSQELISSMQLDSTVLTLKGTADHIAIFGDAHCLEFIHYLYKNTSAQPLQQLISSTYLPSSILLYQIHVTTQESHRLLSALKNDIQKMLDTLFNQQIFLN
ncbi:MAG: hypothetical protein KBD63_04290 [Bacteriovoracaceae bacterium]|nr:hypothetical protein [Bacteriovoracaceae bacterium]